eukprot:NODE_2492_length_1567_cov_95.322715_g2146_i0.p1 GENE.NODE_2492_length_1567_cov_95.322715_g2146_i0~~NODE_2492_length_1567_cov_95.322715_g2146_i0.p1  ORF type:complete len:436 (+),score=57.24 NODE_2492_length_1567_cov_95.322715_g2146_i0:77-1384(+)
MYQSDAYSNYAATGGYPTDENYGGYSYNEGYQEDLPDRGEYWVDEPYDEEYTQQQQGYEDEYYAAPASPKDNKPPHPVGIAISAGVGETCKKAERESRKAIDYNQRTHSQVKVSQDTADFEDYAAGMFRDIRLHYGISTEEYIHSMCSSPLTGGAVGEGKSGMLFFFSQDNKYIVKTLTPSEVRLLSSAFKDYHAHMKGHPQTLLPRFFGLHIVHIPKLKQRTRVIVMHNLFPPGVKVPEKYDLKGSVLKRFVTPDEWAKGTSVGKDLNWCNKHDGTDNHGNAVKADYGPSGKDKAHRKIWLGPLRKAFIDNLIQDAKFLELHNMMDYSCLVGILHQPPHREEYYYDPDPSVPGSLWSMSYGGVRARDYQSNALDELYYVGVIDILQGYDAKKKLEHAYKSSLQTCRGKDPALISAVPASMYAKRFLAWMDQHTG